MNDSHNESLQVYNRQKEDALLLDVALLKEQLQNLQQEQEASSNLLTQLLEDKIEAKAREDFINRVLAPIGTLIFTIIGALLGYAIPTYMSKH
jgi:hypothetical protein